MKTIWKYKLTYEQNKYEIPKGAKVLDVQMQGNDICLWALVDPKSEKEIRIFEIFGTGLVFNVIKEYTYIATIQIGWFVGHVFEIK